MPQFAKTPESKSGNEGPQRSNLSRWFWGTIVILFVISVSIKLLATWQAGRQGAEIATGSSVDQTLTKATLVEQWINLAGEDAHKKASNQINARLDEAYAPVYANIPKYMDFHYSLSGEWLELGSAAMGQLGAGLEKHLFAGIDTRLTTVSEGLALEFDQSFQTALNNAMAAEAGGVAALGPEVTKVLRESQNRMQKLTGPAGVALVWGGTLTVFTTTFAKKLSIKLAAKVGTKTGMKWAAATSVGAASAAACSWTGPGAGACAVAGAAITWVATDVAMIKLDEHLSRDEFARDLHQLIDDHKKEIHDELIHLLARKSLAVDAERKIVVRDIALSELKDVDRLIACQTVDNILGRYDDIRGNLNARSSADLAVFRADLEAKESDQLLAPWIDELTNVITHQDLRPWILGPVILNVDFPEELDGGRKIWGELRLAGSDIEFLKTESDTVGKYSLKAQVEEKIFFQGKTRLKLELVQDRGWTSRNRNFEGSAWLDVAENFPGGSGSAPKATISLTMTSGHEEGPMPRVEVVMIPDGAILPRRVLPEFCTQSSEAE